MPITEQKRVGLDFLYSFYTNIQQLKHNRATYRNLLIELNFKMYGDGNIDLKKVYDNKDKREAVLEEQEKANLLNSVQIVRYYLTSTYDTLKVIKTRLNLKEQTLKEIEEAYNKISSKYIIPDEELGNYVILMDALIFDSVISETLQNNTDTINAIYGTNTNSTGAANPDTV